MNPPQDTWPPRPEPPWRPPEPEPPFPPRTPWHPGWTVPTPGPVSASASLLVPPTDWLAERLLDQRVIALAGEVDAETANRTVAELALLDASGDEPVQLRLSGVRADVDTVLTLVDALDLMGVPVHATCLGHLTGAAVAVLAVADHRVAGAHAVLELREPSPGRGVHGLDVEGRAAEHARQVRRLQERLAEACGRPVEEVAADMRAGRALTATEAQEYGLVDVAEARRGAG
ncbi:ATP-dependent Clp protease proteolytic subunit [Modestobacter marinus]|uniref:ATP-dependent Clp protease proteolytic subunit n=1 Tax=Modestobacter marinus TaxID=477641 RepID=UPI001C95D6B0|nr:ATP-dependent Clp protease proteolytic subunit [Modestobacter marinus]